jgi:hypothetical protein
MAAAVAAHQEKEVLEVAEDAARQAVALLQAQSVDIATVESTAGAFLGPYRAIVDLVASADDAAMAEVYVVGMVVLQESPDEEDGASDEIEALFSDSNDGDVVMPATTDEQVALMASFETAHRKKSTRLFMGAEREALTAMLVVRANAAREAARGGPGGGGSCGGGSGVGCPGGGDSCGSACGGARQGAAAEAATQEDMARDRRRWDDNMAAARRTHEVHELAT